MLNSPRKAIGFRIKMRRLIKGLSQDEVAIALNCSRSKISKIESGKQEAEASFLFDLADFLEVSIEEFNPKQNYHIDRPQF